MNGSEGVMLSDISQTEKDKYCIISLIVESKKQMKVSPCTLEPMYHN